VAVFLSVIGAKTYTLLRNLLAPTKLKEASLASLTCALKNHFEPKRVVITERFHSYRRNQEPGESIADYVAELRRLSMHCDFEAAQLEEALRDLLVCSLRNETCQRRLLTKSDLTFQEALKIAQSMEAAETNAQQQLKGVDATIQLVATRSAAGITAMEIRPCF